MTPQLPPDCVLKVLKYVGPGQYRFMAGVNRTWRDSYDHIHGPEDDDIEPRDYKITTLDAAVKTVACARVFLNEASTERLWSMRFHPTLLLASFARKRRSSGLEELETSTALSASGNAF